MPAVVVGDESQGREADLRLPRQLRPPAGSSCRSRPCSTNGTGETPQASRIAGPPCRGRCRRGARLLRHGPPRHQRACSGRRRPGVRARRVPLCRARRTCRYVPASGRRTGPGRQCPVAGIVPAGFRRRWRTRATRRRASSCRRCSPGKLSSDGRTRWPAPWRARNATRRPARVPTTYGAEGAPNGVVISRSSRSASWAHVIQPAPADDADRDSLVSLHDAAGSSSPASAPRGRRARWRGARKPPARPPPLGRGVSVDQPDPARLETCQGRRDVVDAQRDVVDPGSATGHEAPDR